MGVGLTFANGGQICVSPNRVYVEKSIYEKFLEKVVAKVGAYVFGSGDDHEKKDEVLQPVVSEQSLGRLLRLIDDARAKGARVLCGGARENRPGFFFAAYCDCRRELRNGIAARRSIWPDFASTTI